MRLGWEWKGEERSGEERRGEKDSHYKCLQWVDVGRQHTVPQRQYISDYVFHITTATIVPYGGVVAVK
jgi:hypothetical protein